MLVAILATEFIITHTHTHTHFSKLNNLTKNNELCHDETWLGCSSLIDHFLKLYFKYIIFLYLKNPFF